MENKNQFLLSSGIFRKEKVLMRNEILKQPDTIDTNIYYIQNGSFKIYINNDGKEQIIRLGYSGDILLAMDSFIKEEKSNLIIQTIKKSDILISSKKDFLNFVYSSTTNVKMYLSMLEELTVQQLEREKDLLINSPKKRYEKVFRRNPKLFQLIPNKHIANYLRMSSETLSRLKSLDFNQ